MTTPYSRVDRARSAYAIGVMCSAVGMLFAQPLFRDAPEAGSRPWWRGVGFATFMMFLVICSGVRLYLDLSYYYALDMRAWTASRESAQEEARGDLGRA